MRGSLFALVDLFAIMIAVMLLLLTVVPQEEQSEDVRDWYRIEFEIHRGLVFQDSVDVTNKLRMEVIFEAEGELYSTTGYSNGSRLFFCSREFVILGCSLEGTAGEVIEIYLFIGDDSMLLEAETNLAVEITGMKLDTRESVLLSADRKFSEKFKANLN